MSSKHEDITSIQTLIAKRRVFSAAVIDSADHAVPLAKALLAGGLDVMEITLRNNDAVESIRRIAAEVPGMTVGAGTVLSAKQLDDAMDAGARFGLSPGFNPSVIGAAVERGCFFIPGVMTPGEMEQSMELGCPWVKLFPAEQMGLDFIKAISAPYGHTPLRLIPLGGVNQENLGQYLACPMVVAVGGSWLTNRKLASEGRWSQITESVRQTLSSTASLTA